MLVSMKEILARAREQGYAVAAPNVCWELEARAVIEAAEEMDAPLILDVAFFLHPDIVFLGGYLRELAEQSSVPIAINLDHGSKFSEGIAALRAGFTGIMVDRSSLPLEENIREVRELTRIAHSVGVSVEAELGHVGNADETQEDPSSFTNPQEAVRFVEETEVDCLAIAIGTAHGLYKGTPALDFGLLNELRKAVRVPLVLHGGSGTGEENLRKACSMGINKVNVFSELAACAYEEIARADTEHEPGFMIWNHIQDGFRNRLKQLIVLFGSDGKNWSGRTKGIRDRKIVF